MTIAQEISALRKSQHLEDALKKAREAFALTPNDFYLQQAYGWVIYEIIKRDAKQLEAGHCTASQLESCFTTLLREYAKLEQVERPGLLHSLILTQVLKGDEVWPNFLAFAKWWNPASLRQEDRLPYKTDDGKTIPSLEMRLAYAVGRALVGYPSEGKEEVRQWAESYLENVLAENPNDQWLHYYKSKRLLKQSRTKEAQEHLLPVVVRQKGTAWVWSLLGQTYETNEPEKAITCYYYAIQVASKPEEVLKTRVRLAQLLVAGQRFQEAARQVYTAIGFRDSHQYRIPQDLAQLRTADWFRRITDKESLPFEPNVREEAQSLLRGLESDNATIRRGVIDHHNLEKGLAHVAFSLTEDVILPYRKFKNVHQMSVGTIVEVGLLGASSEVIYVSASQARTVDGFCIEHKGLFMKRPEQNFGFIDTVSGLRIFIPPSLVESKAHRLSGTSCKCLAIRSKDRKRGTIGWKALTIHAEADSSSDKLAVAYREMAEDEMREAEALAWSEGTMGDMADSAVVSEIVCNQKTTTV